MKFIAIIGVLVALLVLSTCAEESPEKKAAKEKATAESSYKYQGKQRVLAMMKDPGSVKFGRVYVKTKGAHKTVCGTLNAKNSFGGYTGHKRFLSSVRRNMTLTEGSIKEFDLSWRRYCI